MAVLDWMMRPIAHRGLHDAAAGIVENTPGAIEAAIVAGYGVEIDVQPALGGEPVVFHDATLDRLTTSAGRIDAQSPAALSRIQYRDTGDRIVTLAETLELIGGRTPLFVEIKSGWSGTGAFAARVARELAPYAGPAAAMSFDPAQVAALREAAPALPRGLVSERFDDDAFWNRLSPLRRLALRHLLSANRTRPHFIAYDINALPASAPGIARKLFGCKLLTWTVRTPEQRRRAQVYADTMIFEGFRPDMNAWVTSKNRP